MSRLRLSIIVYIAALGLATLGLAILMLARTSLIDLEQGMLAVLLTSFTAIAILFPIQRTTETKLSLHTSAVLAAVLVFEPVIAMLVAGAGMLVGLIARRQPREEILFNTFQIMLQAGVGGWLLTQANWDFNTLTINHPLLVVMLFVVVGVMFLIETTSIAIMAALENGQSPLDVWRQIANFDSMEWGPQFALGLLAAVVADAHIWALPLLLPLAFVIYRSSKRQLQLGERTKELAYQAFHDPLTSLPNRALLFDRIEHALARSERRSEGIAILFLDLDRFKYINDSLGHDIGDQLLVAVAERLRACLRPEDTVARLGGDEFTILLEDIAHLGDATGVAERVLQALQAPFMIAGHELFITTSIGIALSGAAFGHYAPGDLLRNADLAMYKAKESGKARYAIFSANMNIHAMDRFNLETHLYQALERGQFEVHYQPQVEFATGRIVCLEALVRWRHPQRGLVPPFAFIPLAEETGLILPIGRWILQEACRQAKAWQELYPKDQQLMVSVNLSAKQFQHAGLTQMIAEVLGESSLSPTSLQLEITESAVMEDVESALATLQELRNLGVGLAIDDFGTGYSSLNYLKNFPVEVLKIDKSFIDRISQDTHDKAIVHAITILAGKLGMNVVAEGIETDEQLAQLRALGCELGQGYYFAKPLPSQTVATLLATNAPTCMLLGTAELEL